VRPGTALLIVATLSSGCTAMARAALEPEARFSRAKAPPAPDYSRPEAWAALPERADGADVVAAGERDGQAIASVDVFFVHPTTYYDDEEWNQPQDDARARELVDLGVLHNQASVFNSAARVYAPRYRQATLFAFMADERQAEAEGALDLAYEDVLRAFDEFIAHRNQGRPIVLASHSQGSRHALRLLVDRFEGRPLADRLVAAYVIGIAIPSDVFTRLLPHVPLCRSALETGCVVTWNTMEEGASLERFRGGRQVKYPEGYESNAGKTIACVNPLSWSADGTRAPRERNLGGVLFEDDADERPEPDRAVVGARCAQGALRVEEPPRAYRRLLGHIGDYHLVDYPLFHLNLRRNVEARVAAFSAARSRGAAIGHIRRHRRR